MCSMSLCVAKQHIVVRSRLICVAKQCKILKREKIHFYRHDFADLLVYSKLVFLFLNQNMCCLY